MAKSIPSACGSSSKGFILFLNGQTLHQDGSNPMASEGKPVMSLAAPTLPAHQTVPLQRAKTYLLRRYRDSYKTLAPYCRPSLRDLLCTGSSARKSSTFSGVKMLLVHSQWVVKPNLQMCANPLSVSGYVSPIPSLTPFASILRSCCDTIPSSHLTPPTQFQSTPYITPCPSYSNLNLNLRPGFWLSNLLFRTPPLLPYLEPLVRENRKGISSPWIWRSATKYGTFQTQSLR